MDDIRKNFYNTNVMEGKTKFLTVDLYNFIHNIHHLNQRKKVYVADQDGQLKFDEIYDQIGALRNLSINENLNAEYSKLPGTILRIAGALHILENVIVFTKK
jgi:hypothetical protein